MAFSRLLTDQITRRRHLGLRRRTLTKNLKVVDTREAIQFLVARLTLKRAMAFFSGSNYLIIRIGPPSMTHPAIISHRVEGWKVSHRVSVRVSQPHPRQATRSSSWRRTAATSNIGWRRARSTSPFPRHPAKASPAAKLNQYRTICERAESAA